MSNLYKIGTETRNKIKKFRTSTARTDSIKALSIKIEPKPSYEIIVDEDEQEELDEIEDLNELAEILPDNSPRFVLTAYPTTTKRWVQTDSLSSGILEANDGRFTGMEDALCRRIRNDQRGVRYF